MNSTTKRWIIGGVVLVGVVLLISEHNSTTTNVNNGTSGSNGTRPCTVRVTADLLSVRSDPDGDASVVDTLDKAAIVSADRTTRNGFRQLGTNRWAARDYLEPMPGSDCG